MLINESEAAKMLGVPVSTLQRARKTGKLRDTPTVPFYAIGRRFMYKPEDIEKWIAARRVTIKPIDSSLLTEKEAAVLLSVSRSFLAIARMQGAFKNGDPAPPFYKLGRAVRYDRDELLEWLKTNHVGGKS